MKKRSAHGEVGESDFPDIGKACISPSGMVKHCYVEGQRADILR